ncbi:DnaJ domain-containing protein [Cryptosporidium felis]|nr:DnaJ domain-containing protein [Cryptosporidium felis]
MMQSEECCDTTFTTINNPYLRLLNAYIERTTVYPRSRWLSLLILLLFFSMRIYYCQVTYGLSIYILNLFIGFLSPQIDPEEEGMVLPVHDSQEFRPFERRLPEFKFWSSATKATIVSIVMTYFDFFDLPVFWPILLIYFIFLFILTMRQQIQTRSCDLLMSYNKIFALPPIPVEAFNLVDIGPVVFSSIAKIIHKKIEPAGEAFFCEYERKFKKIESDRKYITKKVNESDRDEKIPLDINDKTKKYLNKSTKKKNNTITLARLKDLVKEEKTLYEKLGINENVGIKEIRQAYRKLVLSHHPDKHMDNSTARSEKFLKIQEAYEILSDIDLRHKYDSALPFDETIPSIYSEETNNFDQFKKFFLPIFNRNSRWSAKKPVPVLGEKDDSIDKIENFYNFWRGFQSTRDFSIHDEHEVSHAECREEKRWMERQNLKIRSKYTRNEILRINRLVELAYKNDPRVKQYYENINKIKEREKLKKEEEKKMQEEENRLKNEVMKKKAAELKSTMKSLRISVRNKMKKICDTELFFDRFYMEDLSNQSEMIIKEYSEWNDKFLDSLITCIKKQRKSVLQKINFRQWEDWLLKLDENNLEDLDLFLVKWLEKNENFYHDLTLKKLYLIYSLKVSMELNKNTNESTNINVDSEINLINTETSCESRTSNIDGHSEWTVSEMSILAKALQKYPGGFKNRWDMISECLRNTKTREQILSKVKELSNSERLGKPLNEIKEKPVLENFSQANKETPKNYIPNVHDHNETKNINPNAFVRINEKEAELWTKEQQTLLEKSLKKYSSSIPFNERWKLISSNVPGKDPSQCFSRYKFIRDKILSEKRKS